MLVGPDTYDDAGVIALAGAEGLPADNPIALVQTVDYFPPVVDDPYLLRGDRGRERGLGRLCDGREAVHRAQHRGDSARLPGGLDRGDLPRRLREDEGGEGPRRRRPHGPVERGALRLRGHGPRRPEPRPRQLGREGGRPPLSHEAPRHGRDDDRGEAEEDRMGRARARRAPDGDAQRQGRDRDERRAPTRARTSRASASSAMRGTSRARAASRCGSSSRASPCSPARSTSSARASSPARATAGASRWPRTSGSARASTRRSCGSSSTRRPRAAF